MLFESTPFDHSGTLPLRRVFCPNLYPVQAYWLLLKCRAFRKVVMVVGVPRTIHRLGVGILSYRAVDRHVPATVPRSQV